MFRIMVVEDDFHTQKLMKKVLENAGYEPIIVGDADQALDVFDSKKVDLIILDIMLPGMNGFELAKLIRDGGCQIPLLMLTARETLDDRKQGFVSGTDDYMVKPADEEEMLLRIAALLRRAGIAMERKIVCNDTVFDYDSMTVREETQISQLPQKEFLLIYKLLSYQGKIFTRRQLMDEIWNMDSDTDERTVDVHINRLREKFKDNKDFEIVTVRGLGYKATITSQK